MPEMVNLAVMPDCGEDSVLSEPQEPDFPTIFLGDEHVERLGLDGAQVGTEMTMVAIVRVQSVSMRESLTSDSYRSATLDLVQAAVAPVQMSDAEKMFGSD